MTTFSPKRVGRILALTAAIACGWESADGQQIGLYRDGVLVESLGSLRVAGDEPAAHGGRGSGGVSDPSRAARRDARLAASRHCNAVMEDLRQELVRLQAAAGAPTAAERRALAAHRARLIEAAEELESVLEQETKWMARAGAPEDQAGRRAEVVAGMIRNRREFVTALNAAIDGQAGALAEVLALAESYRADQRRSFPDTPEFLVHRERAPRLTRGEADEQSGDPAPAGEIPQAKGEQPKSGPPNAAALAETVEIVFTPEIVAKAAELGNQPLAIYEFVRNEVAFQPYLGSRKGAAGTLAQLAGNDTDQASLLIALLRTSGIPACYARGTVEMTAGQAASWLGVDDPATAGSILTTAGLDGVSITNGPDVVAVRCTRVWVNAYIPYTNYRGVSNADTGKTWIPLDPAFYQSQITAGEDVLASMAFDTETFLDTHVSTVRTDGPVDGLEAEVQGWLDANDPGKTVAQIKRTSAIAPLNLGLVPASLANQVLGTPTSFSELEADKRYKVRFHLHDGATTFIDHTVNLQDLAGHKLIIKYVGATPADQTAIDAAGGIYNTDPLGISVKPVLELDGVALASSGSAIGMGLVHQSDMHFLQPSGAGNIQPVINNDITAGNGQAIAFNTFLDIPSSVVPGTASSSSTSLNEDVMYSTAVDYLRRADDGIRTVGEIMRFTTTQDVSEAIVANSVAVNYNFGTPVSFEWNGLIVDADRRIVGPFPVDGDSSKELPFMKLVGYEGSNQENLIFEETYGQNAVSTIKILQLASDAGISICTITDSIAADCPDLPLYQPASVVSAINSALAQGRHIIIPERPITVGLWSGTGYVNLNPATGAAGYIISGGINGATKGNGGATVDVWPINLGCMPIGPITGTITPDGFAPGAVLCADNSRIAYTVTLLYQCKDADGNIVNQTFGPTSHTVPKTKKTIATTYGSGVYTISIPGTSVTPVSFTLVYLEFSKAKKTVCWESGGNVAMKALLTPTSAQSDALVNWSISGTPAAAIDSSGKVTFGSGGGCYTVTVAAQGNPGCMATILLDIIQVDLAVAQATLTLMEDNTLTATVTPNAVAVSEYKFEIRRSSEAAWYELQVGASNTFTGTARVAGFFKVRVTAKVGTDECRSEEKDVEARFPSSADIRAGTGVTARMDQAWTATKNATTATSRREEGYYITLDTATGAYGVTAYTVASAVANNQGASWDTVTIPRPPDSIASPTPLQQPTYTVGWFHTHTPMTHRTGGTRGVGPSGADANFGGHASIDLPGFAYDYTESPAGSGTIPAGHPLNSAAQIYDVAPTRRSTPP